MSQFFIDQSPGPGGPINTLSAQGGAPTAPLAANFNFEGTGTGAILFATPSNGQMTAAVQVDGTTITVNGSNQLAVVNDEIVGTATTIGAVTQTILTIPMANNSAITIDALVVGFEPTLPGAVGSSLTATFIRTGAGVPTIVKEADDQQNVSATLPNAKYQVSGSGSNIIVTVTGQAGVTINWSGRVRYIVVS